MNSKVEAKKIIPFAIVTTILLVIWFNPPNSKSRANEGRTVTYVVGGQEAGMHGSASLTYTNASGGSEQIHFYGAFPWTLEMRKESGATLYISAQNGDESTSTISVAIYVDGTVLQQARSTEEYGVATASGVVP